MTHGWRGGRIGGEAKENDMRLSVVVCELATMHDALSDPHIPLYAMCLGGKLRVDWGWVRFGDKKMRLHLISHSIVLVCARSVRMFGIILHRLHYFDDMLSEYRGVPKGNIYI